MKHLKHIPHGKLLLLFLLVQNGQWNKDMTPKKWEDFLDSIHLMAYDMKGQKHTDVHSGLHKHDYDTEDQVIANVVSALLKLKDFVFE